ncbi:MAG TPA: hypothetical protein VJP89_18490 [Pyrinomonadaceae bacterium]|nr:hypothetical protein [Pyrinomonadaceae bacterium]
MKAVALFLVLGAAGWQTIDFNGLFTFRLPDGFQKLEEAKPDDPRAEYHKGQTKLIVVWARTESGAYDKRRQDWMHDYHETTTRIRGLRANVRTYSQSKDSKRSYRAELNVGNWDKGQVQIYMRLETDDPAMLEIAEQIFTSINIPLPSPERSSRP